MCCPLEEPLFSAPSPKRRGGAEGNRGLVPSPRNEKPQSGSPSPKRRGGRGEGLLTPCLGTGGLARRAGAALHLFYRKDRLPDRPAPLQGGSQIANPGPVLARGGVDWGTVGKRGWGSCQGTRPSCPRSRRPEGNP